MDHGGGGGLQVAMLANSVMRLSHKMRHNHGHLPHDEQAQLHHHMHLLDDVYLQLQVTATLPASASTSAVDHDTYRRSEPLHQEDEQDCHSGPATTLAHDRRPCSPAGTVGGRRRTKRQFTKRCNRCDTSYTSQWRAGPSGPSTYVLLTPPHVLTTLPSPQLAPPPRSTHLALHERVNHSALVGSVAYQDCLMFAAYMVKTRRP
jgi:hypothetical protein